MSNSNDDNRNLGAFLKEIWGGTSLIIAIVTSLLGFIQLARGDLGLFTLTLLGVAIFALWLTCLYYARFWKPEKDDPSPQSPKFWHRFLPRFQGKPSPEQPVQAQQVKERRRKKIRRLAKLGLFVIPLLIVTGFAGWQYYQSLPSKDFIILVAKFDGPQDYLVTDAIIKNLEIATEEYSHVKIEPLEKSLNNSDRAKKEGKLQKAAIVIWGKYRKTKEVVPISVNFEILEPHPQFPKLGPVAKGKFQTPAVAQLESFELQTRLSQEMAYLSLFTLGMYRYLEEDWDKASERFDKALGALEWAEEPVTALSQEVVYFYLGNSYYYQGNYQQAISDYDRAIEIDPQLADAYNNRGNAHSYQGNYQQAISDYDRAIEIDPQLAQAYYNRGIAHSYQGNYQQAISDYNKAIEINPQYADAYNNRGNAHSYQGNY
ncbi:MAG: tetratricopeptide repeat protein, partial [Xenococcaceae cyanobacterium]